MSKIISKEEYGALIKFRQKIPDLLATFNEYKRHDLWLLKWLRARELNVDKAEAMLRKSMAWFENAGYLDMNWRAPDYIDQEFIFHCPGFDKEGTLIGIAHFGQWNLRRACSMGMRRDFGTYVQQLFDRAIQLMECRSNKENYEYQFVIILDFTGFELKQLASRDTVEAILDLVRVFEGNYPEILKDGWVINAPKYFEVLFAMIKPLATARTLSKIHIHGCTGWREHLLKIIDADQLPSRTGGANTSNPPYRARYSLDWFKTYKTFPPLELTTTIVPAGMKHTTKFKLSVGENMSWNFRTDDYDIGYSVQFQEGPEENPEILFACDKVDSHLHVQKGAIEVERAGTYTLILDNSNSRFRSKTIHYSVRINDENRGLAVAGDSMSNIQKFSPKIEEIDNN